MQLLAFVKILSSFLSYNNFIITDLFSKLNLARLKSLGNYRALQFSHNNAFASASGPSSGKHVRKEGDSIYNNVVIVILLIQLVEGHVTI